MQLEQIDQETRPAEIEDRREVLMQHFSSRNLVMSMRLPQPFEIPLKALFALPFLDLALHDRRIGRQLEGFPIAEPEVVVRFAFQQFYPFGCEGGVEIVEGFFEELREEEKGGSLVETVSIVVD